MPDWNEIVLGLWAFLSVAALAVIGLVALTIAVPGLWRRFLPLPRLRRGSWTGGEVTLAFLVALYTPGAVIELLDQVGFFNRYVSDDLPAGVLGFQKAVLTTPLSLPLVLAILVTMLYARTESRPRNYGLTTARWPHNLVLGILTFLVIVLPVLSFYTLVRLLIPEEKHPVELLVQSGDYPAWQWLLVLMQVCLAAPLLEEVLFRGILQGWLHRASRFGHVMLAGFTLVVGAIGTAIRAGDPGPVLFAAVLILGYQLVIRKVGTNAPSFAAVYGSAMFFAVTHATVWPSPLPLFPLGLALGWLAQRTGSLVGPIVAHALFNAVAFLTLLYGTAS